MAFDDFSPVSGLRKRLGTSERTHRRRQLPAKDFSSAVAREPEPCRRGSGAVPLLGSFLDLALRSVYAVFLEAGWLLDLLLAMRPPGEEDLPRAVSPGEASRWL